MEKKNHGPPRYNNFVKDDSRIISGDTMINNIKTPDYMVNVFESSPVAMICLSGNLRVTMINRTANELTGYSGDFLLGRRISVIMRHHRVKKIITTIRKKGIISLTGYQTRFENSYGEEVPIRLRISSMLDEHGGVDGFLLTAVDMREIKALQVKLLEAERLAAITETAISVNHEINNPLCSILGNTQMMLLENDHSNPVMLKRLKSIEKQIHRIQGITDKLGRIAKPVLKEYINGKKMLDVEASTASGKAIP